MNRVLRRWYKWNPSIYDSKCDEACEMDEYLGIKNCSCEKRLFGKLVIACEDEILNATKTSLVNKRGTPEKNNCLIYTISLIIVCLLVLVVIFVIWYYYYTRDWINKECEMY